MVVDGDNGQTKIKLGKPKEESKEETKKEKTIALLFLIKLMQSERSIYFESSENRISDKQSSLE
jgi:hypothetical protein